MLSKHRQPGLTVLFNLMLIVKDYSVSRTIMLIPTGTSVGLTSVSTGVIRSMEQKAFV